MNTLISSLVQALRPGQRHVHPQPPGAGDAWLLARLARQSGKTLVVFTAAPQDTQRLTDEIALFDPALRVHPMPDWETLPYDTFSPHQDLISQRLQTLHALMQKQVDVLVLPITTALYRLAPPAFLAAHTFFFHKGERLDEAGLRDQLVLANYQHVEQVTAPGEFSIRGGLIDLFPMGSVLPYRLDLFDDTIESIRAFDVDTQRSLYPVKDVRLLPGREFPLDEDSRTAFRARFREVFEGDPSRALPYRDVGNGIAFPGIEYYLPLFFEQTATLFDYLPEGALTVTLGEPEAAIQAFWQDTRSRYQFLKSDRERPILAPEALLLRDEDFFLSLKPFPRLALAPGQPHPDLAVPPDVSVHRQANDPLARLRAVVEGDGTRQVLLCADAAGRRETLVQMLAEHGLKPQAVEGVTAFFEAPVAFAITVAPLSMGFGLRSEGLLLITESDLYPGHAPSRGRRQRERTSNVEAMVRDLSELRTGDPVVHAQHGIGRYRGLVSLDLGEGETEFLHLEYANAANLYVPVAQLHVIARYSGADPDAAPLHQLGSGQWEKGPPRRAARRRDRCATPPPNYWTSMPSGPRARVMPSSCN